MIKRYNPATDDFIEITQDDWDVLEGKIILISRIMRIKEKDILSKIAKYMNENAKCY